MERGAMLRIHSEKPVSAIDFSPRTRSGKVEPRTQVQEVVVIYKPVTHPVDVVTGILGVCEKDKRIPYHEIPSNVEPVRYKRTTTLNDKGMPIDREDVKL